MFDTHDLVVRTTESPYIKVKKNLENAVLPKLAGPNEVGYDLVCVKFDKKINNNTYMYDTGISIEVPNPYYTEIVPRSSIVKSGYMLANSVGIIDPTYRGNLKIVLVKVEENAPELTLPFTICQLIIRNMIHLDVKEVDNLSDTSRGEGGFGSTNDKLLYAL